MKTFSFQSLARFFAIVGLFACTTAVFAQDDDDTSPAQKQYYKQRELSAKPAVKDKLNKLRAEIKAQNKTYEVGATAIIERPLNQLATLKAPDAQKAEKIKAALKLKNQKPKVNALSKVNAQCFADQKTYLPNKLNLLTPIRDQGACGSCWDFAAVAAYELNNMFATSTPFSSPLDLSEQNVLDCAFTDSGDAGDCNGGWPGDVFDWMVSKNGSMTSETDDVYTAAQATCKAISGNYLAHDWDYVSPSGDWAAIPSVQQIKDAICAHGSVVCAVNATDAFLAYTSGIFNETKSKGDGNINHAIVIVGWNDNQKIWIIRNSWGTGWGNQGFMKIKYDSNNVGSSAMWVESRQ